jgi:hypothetical protein
MTGKEQWMKEPYTEDLANHGGHESCAGDREVSREAFDSGMYRLGIEPRKMLQIRVPMRWATLEGNISDIDMRDITELCVVGDPIHVQKLFTREPGDPTTDLVRQQGPYRKSKRSTPMMNGCRKSDNLVVPEKSLNKPDMKGAEEMEGRGLPKGNERSQNMHRTQSRESMHNELQLIHQKAKKDKNPNERFGVST